MPEARRDSDTAAPRRATPALARRGTDTCAGAGDSAGLLIASVRGEGTPLRCQRRPSAEADVSRETSSQVGQLNLITAALGRIASMDLGRIWCAAPHDPFRRSRGSHIHVGDWRLAIGDWRWALWRLVLGAWRSVRGATSPSRCVAPFLVRSVSRETFARRLMHARANDGASLRSSRTALRSHHARRQAVGRL